MAPDIDADVAAARIYRVISDPDLPYGNAPEPRGTFPPADVRLTVYVSPDDKALTVSQYQFGSLRRFGRTDVATLGDEEVEQARKLGVMDMIQVSGTTDYFGHSYFVSNPAVSSDLIALIGYGLKPGEAGRPLTEIAKPYWRIRAESPPATK
jgi:esterase/lipase superfamily enzyme